MNKMYVFIVLLSLVLSYTIKDNSIEENDWNMEKSQDFYSKIMEFVNNKYDIIKPPFEIKEDKEEKKNDLPQGIDKNWFYSVIKNIRQEEYHINKSYKGLGDYSSPNRRQNLRAFYRSNGFSLQPLVTKIVNSPDEIHATKGNEPEKVLADWKIDFLLLSISKGNKGLTIDDDATFKAEKEKLTISHSDFYLEYINNENGVRQNFIVMSQPQGKEKLKIAMKVETSLILSQESDDEIKFYDAENKSYMSYSNLKVWDSDGDNLPARIILEDNICYLEVSDKAAKYPITIDPLSSTPDWTDVGENADDGFGCSVSSAGDVNGDGYSDVVVGAYQYNGDQDTEGRVYVYHGSATGLSTTANWTAESDQQNSFFGFSVSNAGDVNGDGYSDVIVGAFQYDGDQSDVGRAYVYHGSANGLSTTANWTAEGNQVQTYFGYGVSNAGDVNGDGYSDVVVGEYRLEFGQDTEGRAHVYHGSATGLSSTQDWTDEGETENDKFGQSISTAGDVNGDGYSDIIVGAYKYNGGQLNEGRAYVYHGSANGLSTTANWTVESNEFGAFFGNSVSNAGDVNGDGYSDVIVGTRYYSGDQAFEGKAYVYHGSANGLSTTANWTAEGNQILAYFGYSVSNAGDINGDGYSDIIIGAYFYDGGQENEGRAYVYHGSANGLSTTSNWIAESNQENAIFGVSVSYAGDVNGDGYSDVIVGAAEFDDGINGDAGKAYVYHGSPAGLEENTTWSVGGENYGDLLGFSLSSAGDVNGDGYSDFLMGASKYGNDAGKVYVFYGSNNGPSTTADWTATGEASHNRFGNSVSSAGDVNGDGFSDIIIGANEYDAPSKQNCGKVYAYHGSSSGLSSDPDWTAEGENASDAFGHSVSTAGDVNGDGYSDVVISANYYRISVSDYNSGKVYVYHGAEDGLSQDPDWEKEAEQESQNFGSQVSSCGDVNGDGYSDIIIASVFYDDVSNNDVGKAYVFHGSDLGLSSSADWTKIGENASDQFSYSFAVGDVNGDGYSDVFISSPYFESPNFDGKIYGYYGSSSGLSSTSDWAKIGSGGDRFGFAMSSAGDVNGDGYSDIMIGKEPFHDQSVHGYYGASSGLSTNSDWSKEPNNPYVMFGNPVSSCGDVNGDGYSDIIISDILHNFNGRVDLYYGNDGLGLDQMLGQYEGNGSTRIVPALISNSASSVMLGLRAKDFLGRANVRIEYEVKKLGEDFDGTGTTKTTWHDAAIGTSDIITEIEGLNFNKLHKWRARVIYDPVTNPQVYGPWYYPPFNSGLGEADFRVYTYTKRDEVWYCEDYCDGCDNDGYIWDYTAFNDLDLAENAVVDGGVVHIACIPDSPIDDIDIKNILSLGNNDIQINGDITGDGCFATGGTGHLIRNNSSPLIYPLCFNGYKFYIEISWSIGNAQSIGVRINADSFYQLISQVGAIWHLKGPEGLGATIKFKIPKDYLPDGTKLDKMLLSSQQTDPWLEFGFTRTTEVIGGEDYHVITVNNVNKF